MKAKTRAVAVGVLAAGLLLMSCQRMFAQTKDERLVRVAELEIDPGRLDAYKAALREEIGASIRLEPGVLTLYAVAVKDHPNQIRLFEPMPALLPIKPISSLRTSRNTRAERPAW